MPNTFSEIRGSWLFKVALALTLIALGDWMFWQRGWEGGFLGLFGITMLAALIAAQPALGKRGPAMIALGFAALHAVAMVISPSVLAWLLFWASAAMAALLSRMARFDDGWRWVQRLVGHAIFTPFAPVGDAMRAHKARRKRMRLRKRAILPVLVLPFAGSVAFVCLFAAANPVIQSWFASVGWPTLGFESIGRVVFWLMVFVLAWALLRPRLTRPVFGLFDGCGDFAIPGISPQSVLLSLMAFNAIFLVQNGMDAAWLWGIAPLPDGMTLADYAHRGAYPLVATALLAALFVLVALRPGSQTAAMPIVRRLVVVWVAQNLVLVANAALRTFDYIDAYSLTVLRIAALLWMALVAVGLILVLWRMLADKSAQWLVNANLAAAAILLTAICFVDLGAVAAWWNVRHAREVDGSGARLDLCYLSRLEGSALLPLIALERRSLPASLHGRVAAVRKDVQRRLDARLADGGWSVAAAARAAEARRLAGRPGPRAYKSDCDGRRIRLRPAPARSLPSAGDRSAPPAPPPTLTEGPEA